MFNLFNQVKRPTNKESIEYVASRLPDLKIEIISISKNWNQSGVTTMIFKIVNHVDYIANDYRFDIWFQDNKIYGEW